MTPQLKLLATPLSRSSGYYDSSVNNSAYYSLMVFVILHITFMTLKVLFNKSAMKSDNRFDPMLLCVIFPFCWEVELAYT